MLTPEDPIEEHIALGDGRELRVLRPRDTEALLDEHAFEHDEYLPYWAELWPSGAALARHVGARSLRGAHVLELGCGGLALPSIAAALAGGRALATDWAPDAIGWARLNASRNGARIETARESWAAPEVALTRAPWNLVLAADVLYERRNIPLLLDLLPRLGAEALVADPGRAFAEEFLEQAAAEWDITSAPDRAQPRVAVHHLRRRS